MMVYLPDYDGDEAEFGDGLGLDVLRGAHVLRGPDVLRGADMFLTTAGGAAGVGEDASVGFFGWRFRRFVFVLRRFWGRGAALPFTGGRCHCGLRLERNCDLDTQYHNEHPDTMAAVASVIQKSNNVLGLWHSSELTCAPWNPNVGAPELLNDDGRITRSTEQLNDSYAPRGARRDEGVQDRVNINTDAERAVGQCGCRRERMRGCLALGSETKRNARIGGCPVALCRFFTWRRLIKREAPYSLDVVKRPVWCQAQDSASQTNPTAPIPPPVSGGGRFVGVLSKGLLVVGCGSAGPRPNSHSLSPKDAVLSR